MIEAPVKRPRGRPRKPVPPPPDTWWHPRWTGDELADMRTALRLGLAHLDRARVIDGVKADAFRTECEIRFDT